MVSLLLSPLRRRTRVAKLRDRLAPSVGHRTRTEYGSNWGRVARLPLVLVLSDLGKPKECRLRETHIIATHPSSPRLSSEPSASGHQPR